MKSSSGWWLGLFVLFIVFSTYHIIILDMGWGLRLGDVSRHIIKFSVAMIIFLLGTLFLKKNTQPTAWMWYIWNWVHVLGMLTLLFLGVYHYLISPLPVAIKYFGSRIHLFLVSPLFYAGMGILSRSLSNCHIDSNNPSN